MQYPIALFQKKIKNPEFWDKVFIYYLFWVPVPRGIYSQTICKLKKELHSLSILLRTKQRTAVVGAGPTGSFPLSYTFPPYHPPSPCHHPWQLSQTAGYGADFALPWTALWLDRGCHGHLCSLLLLSAALILLLAPAD